MQYLAPRWLPGGHAQTIWAATVARQIRGVPTALRRERWSTPDDDFVDVDRFDGAPGQPLLVVFHGLEGSSNSHYSKAFAQCAQRRQWSFAMPHFRGCSGELNLAARAYHSGDFEEIDWILRRFRQQHVGPIYAAGVSLGGNALLRWVQEMGNAAALVVQASAAVCAPVDLTASGQAMGRGFARHVYTRMFLRTMKPRALAKLAQHPGLFDQQRLVAARDLYDFDNAFTAPVHGFRHTEDYWQRASSKPGLSWIRIPTLVVNPLNDPFVPASCLPRQSEVGAYVSLSQPRHGGHVGFPAGRFPGHVRAMPEQVSQWLERHG